MQDKDLMPWGKYKGIAMANIPASYLKWCYDNNKCCKQVKEYIEENADVLDVEIKREQLKKEERNG